ncbi:MAG TPA: class I SAM-dependent methyltransferase, partial [Phycisphaerae bacterium]|nr:class I SAM-dependent methyltransferase [Phycisphaerae bacterium]
VGRVCPEIFSADCGLKIADVGCGGGFPILPLACVNPQLDITGIECRGKKTQFISEAARELGLPNVKFVTAQAREVGRAEGHAGVYDVILMRAVGESGRMLREVRNLVAAGGRVINYKTPQAVAGERLILAREAGKFGFDIVESMPFELPCGGGLRQFVILNRNNG